MTSPEPGGDDAAEGGALPCRRRQSVAEVSALLSLPLGVVRVLVGDMADEGLVRVHGPAGDGRGPDPALLQRVLDGYGASNAMSCQGGSRYHRPMHVIGMLLLTGPR
jgi:hypothetical protein